MNSNVGPTNAGGEDAASSANRLRCIAGVIASLTLGGAAMGMTSPLVAFSLKKLGVSATVIGANSAMQAVALLALVFALPGLLRKLGAVRAIYAGLALWAGGVLLMSAFSGPGPWLGLRLFLSVGFGIHWIVGEAWVNAAATERNRGRVVGTYVTLAALGFAAGPVILDVTGFEGMLPFAVVAAIVAAAAAPLILMPKVASPQMPEATDNFANVARVAPVAMAMGLIAGFCDVTLAAMFPVYGLDIGLTTDGTISLLVAFLVGTAVLQWPLGWLTEHVRLNRLAIACSLLVIAAALVMPHLARWPAALAVIMFLWGGAQIGFYTLGLVELGVKFKCGELVGANTVFAFLYGVGALTGPLAGGGAMDAWGPNGLPITLAAAAGMLLLLGVAAPLRHGSQPA